jgi:hypothetical protein
MKQIEVAKKYLDQRENEGNKFDDNTLLGKMLHEAGQKDGEAWCCYFMEGVFCEAFPEKNAELRKLFSASAVATFDNFKKDDATKCHDRPKPGDLVIFQKYEEGKPTWKGHAAVVTDVNQDGSFHTIEGNTNGAGSREGDRVAIKLRRNIKTDNGLNIYGFVTVE